MSATDYNPFPPIPKLTTFDTALAETKDYKLVHKFLIELWTSGIIQKGGGYCLSMTDMIRTILAQHNIDSDVVECKLTVMGQNPPGLLLVGHDGLRNSTQLTDMDTHFVCVTKTEIPMLIDLSIFNVRPEIPFICERLNATNESLEEHLLAKYQYENSSWIYQAKEASRLPQTHQISMLNRIKNDLRVHRDINYLKSLGYVGLGLSIINFIINMTILLTQSTLQTTFH